MSVTAWDQAWSSPEPVCSMASYTLGSALLAPDHVKPRQLWRQIWSDLFEIIRISNSVDTWLLHPENVCCFLWNCVPLVEMHWMN